MEHIEGELAMLGLIQEGSEREKDVTLLNSSLSAHNVFYNIAPPHSVLFSAITLLCQVKR